MLKLVTNNEAGFRNRLKKLFKGLRTEQRLMVGRGWVSGGLGMETLEPRLLMSVTAAADEYTINEDELLRTDRVAVLDVNNTWDYLDQMNNEWDTADLGDHDNDPLTVDTWAPTATAEDYPLDGDGDAWNSVDFNVGTSDASIGAWLSGAGPFEGDVINGFNGPTTGLGGIDEAPDGAHNNVTTYLFRSESFDVAGSAGASDIRLTYVFDDGAVVYLNGQEIHRVNITGPVVSDTVADGSGNENAEATDTIALPAGLLMDSGNVLAVELHQSSTTSSDAGMSLSVQLIMDTGLDVLVNDDISLLQGTLIITDGVGNTELIVTDNSDGVTEVGRVEIGVDGHFVYTPTLPNFNGTASFVYILNDDGLVSSPGFVTMTILPVNDVPTGSRDAYFGTEGTAFSVTEVSVAAPTVLINTGDTWDYFDELERAEAYPLDGGGECLEFVIF